MVQMDSSCKSCESCPMNTAGCLTRSLFDNSTPAAQKAAGVLRRSPANRRSQVGEFLLDRRRVRKGLCDLLAEHFLVALAQAMHRHLHCGFGHIELLGDDGIGAGAVSSGEQRLESSELRNSRSVACVLRFESDEGLIENRHCPAAFEQAIG